MFRRELEIDSRSYLELVSRISGNDQFLALVMRGPKDPKTVALASVMLRPNEVQKIIDHLQDWLKQLDAEPQTGPQAIQV